MALPSILPVFNLYYTGVWRSYEGDKIVNRTCDRFNDLPSLLKFLEHIENVCGNFRECEVYDMSIVRLSA